MLVLARESRGMTQADVAETITRLLDGEGTVSQGYVSKAEAGRLSVGHDRLRLYAAALGYPESLLTLNDDVHGAGVGLVYHRKRASLSATALRRIHALLNLTRIQVQALLEAADRRPVDKFITFEVDDFDTAEDAAQALRSEWGLPGGAVNSVIGAIEDAGGLVARRVLAGRDLDAVSQRPAGGNPVFLAHASAPADRQRFTLAHEIGHVVMHRVPGPGQEQQANQFASEFLMPARDIRGFLSGRLDLARFLELKGIWGVSAAALAHRAHVLGAVSDWQYRQFQIEMSALGYRTNEPGPLVPERPTILPGLVMGLMQERGYTVADLAQLTHLNDSEFAGLYLSDDPATFNEDPDTRGGH
jgi:Zn-dependent peptidase ImmA (M78 family)